MTEKKRIISGLAPYIALAISLSAISPSFSQENTQDFIEKSALVGTWTSIPEGPLVQKPNKPSEGIYRLRFNRDGTLTPIDFIKMKSPSWIEKSHDGRFAYTTNEENAGAVTALSIDKSGGVKVINSVDSQGQQPTHAVISPDGKFLIASNYSVVISPDGRFIITANRGHDNTIVVLKVNTDRTLGSPVRYPALGIEPRAFSFDLTGKYLYVANAFKQYNHVCV